MTDAGALTKILSTWVACPLLAGADRGAAVPSDGGGSAAGEVPPSAAGRLYAGSALILAGAFGSYSLGANNIANVMGVFVPVSPFTGFSLGGIVLTLSSVQQLFLLGAIAIGVGVFTYSKRVMLTVGSDLLPLSPVAAWVVVTSHSIVLFLFASESLEHTLAVGGPADDPAGSGVELAGGRRGGDRDRAAARRQEHPLAGARRTSARDG